MVHQVPVDGRLRLMGDNASKGQGRLEVIYNGTWGTVCDDDFGPEEAGVACWQLGFGRHDSNYSSSGMDSGSGVGDSSGSNLPILLDDVRCQGNESRLQHCQHRPWGQNDCRPEEHVMLACRVDPCRSSPCQNDGTCIALDDVTTACLCSPNTLGRWCENYIDFCQTDNGGCSHQCINGHGSYHCACPDDSLYLSADGHTCYAPTMKVVCGRTMEVAFPRQHWPGLHEQYATLSNSSCVASSNATHVTVSVPLDACGTQSKRLSHGFIFENQVLTRDAPVAGLVSRVRDVNMTTRCHYDDDLLLDNWYIVNSGKIHFSDIASGHYQLSMDLFHNGQKNVGNPQEKVEPGENLSLKLSLSTNDSSLQVFARDCKATPSSDTQASASQYLFLDDGCSNNPTLHDNRTSDAQETLELQAFRFLAENASSALIMHCDVIVCNVTDPGNRCSQGCLTGSDGIEDDDVLTTWWG